MLPVCFLHLLFIAFLVFSSCSSIQWSLQPQWFRSLKQYFPSWSLYNNHIFISNGEEDKIHISKNCWNVQCLGGTLSVRGKGWPRPQDTLEKSHAQNPTGVINVLYWAERQNLSVLGAFADHTGLLSMSWLCADSLGWAPHRPAHLLPGGCCLPAISCPLPCWKGSSRLQQTQPPFKNSLFRNRELWPSAPWAASQEQQISFTPTVAVFSKHWKYW